MASYKQVTPDGVAPKPLLNSMPVSWSKLVGLRDEIPVEELGAGLGEPMCALPLIGEGPQSNQHFNMRRWFKIGRQQYMKSDYGLARGFAWAASDAAFAYVLTNDSYFDDLAVSIPPGELLPDGRSFDWPAIVHFGQASGDWVFSNYEHRSLRQVSFHRFYFYYRHPVPSPDEAPIVIQVFPKVGPRLDALPASSDGDYAATVFNSGTDGAPPKNKKNNGAGHGEL